MSHTRESMSLVCIQQYIFDTRNHLQLSFQERSGCRSEVVVYEAVSDTDAEPPGVEIALYLVPDGYHIRRGAQRLEEK